ncbi:hypothetical protein AOB57_005920 [Methanosarcina flavescens]|uniref:Uncharacterized protein n=1 Tax=Methanosarcina flavescens TaxID=1715806 RepID=A0A660HRU4_9EURY|nr:hypothetical protein AOB57_005920 [Methanosarcina flavescens]
MESFNFYWNLARKQDKKQIVARINYALEHLLKVGDTNKAFYSTNICYILIIDQFNKSVRKDILFRVNGLYKEINKLYFEINNINSPEKQNKIVHN